MPPAKPYVPVDQCPNCGFGPLHHRTVEYRTHIEKMYQCAICGHRFSETHDRRSQ